MRVLWLVLFVLASAAHADVQFWRLAWPNTDFSKTSVDFDDILDGGPGKDGIPAIDAPSFHSAADETVLQPAEPVITLQGSTQGSTPRAYPLRYLIWHEIVNDTLDGVPIAVTYCPLCNSAVVFDRRLEVGGEARTLSLGVSGLLRNSDMIMYDRQTESWWQQFTGAAIVGDLRGRELARLPSFMESWQSFSTRNPDGQVMTQPPAARRYGANPYQSYDTGRPFLYFGEDPPFGINPLARVVVVGDKAWVLSDLRKAGVIEADGLILRWTAGTASALDTTDISKGRDVGAVRVKSAATGEDIVHDVVFAFVFQAFNPNGTWVVNR